MRLLSYPILADENIDPRVIEGLRARRFDVETVFEASLAGRTDQEVLRYAVGTNRVVLTHDRDFGRLSILQQQDLVGVVFLRPGDIDDRSVLNLIEAIEEVPREPQPPFLIVAETRSGSIRVRIRELSRG